MSAPWVSERARQGKAELTCRANCHHVMAEEGMPARPPADWREVDDGGRGESGEIEDGDVG
eukprot:3505503-Rhodomonas_salina.2